MKIEKNTKMNILKNSFLSFLFPFLLSDKVCKPVKLLQGGSRTIDTEHKIVKKVSLLFSFMLITLFSVAQQLPSEAFYEQEIANKYTRYDHGNGYTNPNNPNNDYTNNEMYVQRIESYFEVETGYMDNPYWTGPWSSFSHLIEMFNHLPNYDTFKKYMFSDYFSDFWSNINKDKSNQSERDRFYKELRMSTVDPKPVNSPAEHSLIVIAIVCTLYFIVKKRKAINTLQKENK